MKYIEQSDGSYISDKIINDIGYVEGGTDWEENILISIDENVEIVYNEKRLWKESIKHLGRNDRCICNSGKKFKKCCINKEL